MTEVAALGAGPAGACCDLLRADARADGAVLVNVGGASRPRPTQRA